jgi:hypothetical protein
MNEIYKRVHMSCFSMRRYQQYGDIHIFPGVGIGLDPQAVTHGRDRALEQLGPPDLGFEEALEGVGRRLGISILPLQL